LPERRRGTAVIKAVLQEAAAAGAMTELLVSKGNPANDRLYTRLGFTRGRMEGDDCWTSAGPLLRRSSSAGVMG
jgi:GNAT superfamily N-acetyltransferase